MTLNINQTLLDGRIHASRVAGLQSVLDAISGDGAGATASLVVYSGIQGDVPGSSALVTVPLPDTPGAVDAVEYQIPIITPLEAAVDGAAAEGTTPDWAAIVDLGGVMLMDMPVTTTVGVVNALVVAPTDPQTGAVVLFNQQLFEVVSLIIDEEDVV